MDGGRQATGCGDRCWRALVAWVVAGLFACIAMPSMAAAQAGVVGTPVTTCVAPRAPIAARSLLADPGRFRCDVGQVALGSGDYDLISGPLPPRTAMDWPGKLRFGSVWQDGVTVYALYADGAIAAFPIDGHGASRRLQLGAIVEQRLPVRGVPVVRLLWRVRGSANTRGILHGVTIATPADSARSNMILAALYAGFVGLCIALLIYNLALWAALRHRFQLAYCVMVTTILVYAVSSSGALAWIVPTLANNDRMRVNYLTLALAAIAAVAFARSFFEPRVFAGRMGALSTAMSMLVAITAVLFAALAPFHARLLDRLYAGSFALLLLATVPALWRAWRLRSNYLWMFMLGWAAPIALACLRIASDFALVGWNFWLDNSTVVAMTVEAVLSSLAIAYRIHLLSRERDEAREQEIAARLLAATDPLTGLLNRRAFLERAIGLDGEHRLLLADLDHFKQVNETIGHDGGDEVLRVFARALRTAVPPDALVARVGGEEFAIVVPAAAPVSAAAVLDALRAERMPFDLAVTASIGTCTGPLAREADWKALYRSADRALFEAKASGRDRVRDSCRVSLAA